MAKVVVDKFEKLSGLKGTSFFRLFGRIAFYNNQNGILTIRSLFDESTCEIVLDLENAKSLDMLQPELAVDISVVRKLCDDLESTVLVEQSFNVVMFPNILLENKDTLLQIANLREFKASKS